MAQFDIIEALSHDKLHRKSIHTVITSKLRQPYFLYLLAISLAGLAIVVTGLSQIPTISAKSSLILIIFLAVFADIFATSAIVTDEAMAIEVGTAVSMALIALFSPEIAAVSAAACSLAIWFIFPSKKGSNKNWEQLAFNAGMLSVAIFIAGVVFIFIQQIFGAKTLIGQVIPWLCAAILFDQLNFWLLMGIIRLKQGEKVRPTAIWVENLWALPINIIILSVGGGVLAFAATQLGLLGIIVFFLPIVLSAYAFRLYVSHMQAHMDNLENIVAERTDTLQKVMDEKDAFLAVLTHDMKSPLTSIHLYANMIKSYPHILEQKPHVIDTILHSQEALADIVNNILDLEKLKANGQLPVEKETFDFSDTLQRVFQIMQIQAETKSIDLQILGFDNQIFVHADRHHMERMMNNLLSNAIKYTPSKGKIIVSLQMQDGEICLQVVDSGVGIPEADLPHVFDRFHRVVSHKKLAAGTGLGLAITKALIEAHGGTIQVASEEGKGSKFIVHLPILQQCQPQINQQNRTPSCNHIHPNIHTEPASQRATTFISY